VINNPQRAGWNSKALFWIVRIINNFNPVAEINFYRRSLLLEDKPHLADDYKTQGEGLDACWRCGVSILAPPEVSVFIFVKVPFTIGQRLILN